MYQIMRMAEVVKERGVQIYELVDGANGKKTTKASLSKDAEELFWMAFKKNNPFCFSKTNETPEELKSLLDYESAALSMKEFEAPFEIFSIEVINSLITVANVNSGDAPVNVASYLVSSSTIGSISKSLSVKEEMDVTAVFVLYEYDKVPYVFLEFLYNQGDFLESGKAALLRFSGFDQREVCFYASNAHSHVIKQFTDRLNADKTVGYEKLSDRVKRKRSDGSNEIIKVKRIVHITPKRNQSRYQTENKIDVNWSHRFWRRGHWAHFWKDKDLGIIDYDKIGKNRDGIYCVKGKTWRVESIVGEDHLPLVAKARIVSE